MLRLTGPRVELRVAWRDDGAFARPEDACGRPSVPHARPVLQPGEPEITGDDWDRSLGCARPTERGVFVSASGNGARPCSGAAEGGNTGVRDVGSRAELVAGVSGGRRPAQVQGIGAGFVPQVLNREILTR